MASRHKSPAESIWSKESYYQNCVFGLEAWANLSCHCQMLATFNSGEENRIGGPLFQLRICMFKCMRMFYMISLPFKGWHMVVTLVWWDKNFDSCSLLCSENFLSNDHCVNHKSWVQDASRRTCFDTKSREHIQPEGMFYSLCEIKGRLII
jgi:hypothetical protein